jgi:hypothetical protein
VLVSSLRRGKAHEKADGQGQQRDSDGPPPDRDHDSRDAVAGQRRPCGADEQRAENAEGDREGEREGDGEADAPRPCLVGFVDLVDRAHRRADSARDVPHDEDRGEGDQARGVSGEDPLDARVDRARRRGLEMRLDPRIDRPVPHLLLAERAQERDTEQRQRHQRLQHRERDRARVVEEQVPAEEVEPEPDEAFQPVLRGFRVPQNARR